MIVYDCIWLYMIYLCSFVYCNGNIDLPKFQFKVWRPLREFIPKDRPTVALLDRTNECTIRTGRKAKVSRSIRGSEVDDRHCWGKLSKPNSLQGNVRAPHFDHVLCHQRDFIVPFRAQMRCLLSWYANLDGHTLLNIVHKEATHENH